MALRLFDSGHKDKFVVSCRRAFDSVEGAKATFYRYISRIFATPVIADAFVSQYQLLNKNAIELLEAAHDEQDHLVLIEKQLPLLRHLVTRDARQRGAVLAWADLCSNLVEQAIERVGSTIHELGEHIRTPDDTELFIRFFTSDDLVSPETFTRGAEYWRR